MTSPTPTGSSRLEAAISALVHHSREEGIAYEAGGCVRDLDAEKRTEAARAELRAALAEAEAGQVERPEIVCLCGSTRFMDAFREANLRLTLGGKIVLSIGCDTKSDDALGLTEADKAALDELHKRKIDLCDRVLVLNVGGYIGSSTRSEIEYAQAHGKPLDYLEPIR